MELVETLLSVVLLVLAGTMAAMALLARRDYRDLRFLAIGLGLLLLAVVGATSLFAAIFPDQEPSLDIGLVPLALLVLTVFLLNLPLFVRFPSSRPPEHG